MKPRTAARMYRREAALMLAVARLAVRLLPAQRLIAWASRPPRRINRFAAYEVHAVARAVDKIGETKWMRAACLPRALAAQAMLRRRGIAGKICFGVTHEGEALSAHAWIEIGQQAIVGGGEAPRYTRLVEFGGARAR